MSAETVARILKGMESRDMRVLQGIELGMVSHEYTPVDHISRYSGLTMEETSFRLRRLHALNLIRRRSKPFLGYVLNYMGYDCLALNALVKGGVLEALGKPLGIGKEADIYDALTPEGSRVAVKFARIGRTSFRQTRRARRYVADKGHTSWLYQSRLAESREYEALTILHAKGVKVPKPIAVNRHILVMEVILGAELADYYDLPDPAGILGMVLDNIALAYSSAGIIHGDLSEFNVLIKPDGNILLIDWPQYIPRDHPDSTLFLRRDVKNIVRYFRRKFDLRVDFEKVMERIEAGGAKTGEPA